MARYAVLSIGGCVLSIVVVALGSLWVIRRASATEAEHEVADLTSKTMRVALSPLLTDGFFAGDANDVNRLAATATALAKDTDVLRLKIWTPQGRILYSN